MNAPTHWPRLRRCHLFWAADEAVLMIWGYYDESGEYDADETGKEFARALGRIAPPKRRS
jgi:hypothetical protein